MIRRRLTGSRWLSSFFSSTEQSPEGSPEGPLHSFWGGSPLVEPGSLSFLDARDIDGREWVFRSYKGERFFLVPGVCDLSDALQRTLLSPFPPFIVTSHKCVPSTSLDVLTLLRSDHFYFFVMRTFPFTADHRKSGKFSLILTLDFCFLT